MCDVIMYTLYFNAFKSSIDAYTKSIHITHILCVGENKEN